MNWTVAALALVPMVAWAQSCELAPTAVAQGNTVRVRCLGPVASVRLNGQTVRLFPAASRGSAGLLPVPVETATGLRTVEFLDMQGRVAQTATLTVQSGRFPTQNIRLGQATLALEPSPGEMETVTALRKTVSDTRRWEEPFAAPLPGCQTSPFGVQRLHNGKPTGGYHRGVDQRGPEGTPIRAIAGGTVRIVRQFNIHGGTVGIDHGQGVTSIYLHQSRFAVEEGAAVRQGDVIGYVGSTGRSTAPHLHWGLHVHGVAVNPRQWVDLEPCASAAKPQPTRRKAPQRSRARGR